MIPAAVRNGTKKDRAAILLAEDELSDEAIAEAVGIGRTTLARWKLDPEFAAVVGDFKGQIVADALRLPIAKKMWRVKVLNDSVLADLDAIRLRGETYAARCDTPEEAARNVFGSTTPPWAATGKFVEQPKIAANGKTVTEWAYDKAIESSIIEKLREAAAELGQREENVNLNHSGLTRRYILEDDE